MSNTKKKLANPSQLTEAPKKIPPLTVIRLWVVAGGRCEFNGCNEYLLTDDLTLEDANYSNIGHIVARTATGSRGNDPMPFEKRNNINNLMLLCTKHHKLIDTKELEGNYPKELLLRYKQEHESRIIDLTASQPGNKTFVIRFKSRINQEAVQIPFDHIKAAIHPRYPLSKDDLEIDFTTLPDIEHEAFWETGKQQISNKMANLYESGIETKPIDHISVFGLGPIPLLMYFGNQLSNKITTDLYQKHRDTDNWMWKIGGETTRYKITTLSTGTDKSKVALILSLSGQIAPESIPKNVRKDFTLYEITLDGQAPNTMFLKSKEDLIAFCEVYQKSIGIILKNHSPLQEVLLFPAVPAPVAIMCGRELLKKAHPRMKIYDFNKKNGGFNYTLTVN